jgi:GrpB-like predicted nucleotidyltransferase (UPF0157 family)
VVLSPLALSVEHVGSTAVPGLAAKPVIDLDVVVGSNTDLAAAIARLQTLGYRQGGRGLARVGLQEAANNRGSGLLITRYTRWRSTARSRTLAPALRDYGARLDRLPEPPALVGRAAQ